MGLGYLAAALIMLLVNVAQAHPLGNNTVNRAADIQVNQDAIALRYLLDLAEIPTLLAGQQADADGDGATTAIEWDAYARAQAGAVRDALRLTANGMPLALNLTDSHWQRVPGAAGLDTLRLEFRFSAVLPNAAVLPDVAATTVEYRDSRRTNEAGWKEVVARAGAGARLTRSDAPTTSPSQWLTVYPEEGELGKLGALSGMAPNQVAASLAVEIQVAPARVETLATASPTLKPSAISSSISKALPEPIQATTPPAGEDGQLGRQLAGHTAGHLSANIVAPATSVDSRDWTAFFLLGVHHIAIGWDHLIFLLGLVVAQRDWRRLAWVITAFTLAHSLTLGLAAGGVVNPPGAWVEPAIAASIAYVGLANLTGRLAHGAAVAFGFGLIHGLGFAGALADSLGVGPGSGLSWLGNLLAFNLGIEAFQLGLILLFWPLWHAIQRLDWIGPAKLVSSLVVLGFGLGWLYVRI